MLDVPKKSVETMMLNLKGDDPNAIRNMQHFVSEGSWQDKAILQRHWQEVSHDLGDENGVLIGDGSGFPKQGEESVAVKQQWCGELGKVANCQVGVFLGYASQHGRTLLNRRLYLPQEWVEDEAYTERRRKCGVPEEITFKTKPALLLEMVKAVHAEGTLPFRWLACDEAFGRDTAFLDQVGDYLWYFAEVEKDTRVWLERPQAAVPQWSGQGRKPTRKQLVAGTQLWLMPVQLHLKKLMLCALIRLSTKSGEFQWGRYSECRRQPDPERHQRHPKQYRLQLPALNGRRHRHVCSNGRF